MIIRFFNTRVCLWLTSWLCCVVSSMGVSGGIKLSTGGSEFEGAEFLIGVFSGQVFETVEKEVLGRVSKILGPISKAANLGASISRVDALDFFLTVDGEFGPPGINSMFGVPLERYRAAIRMINDIPFRGATADKIKNSAVDCQEGDCDRSESEMGSGYGDPWGCSRQLR